MSADVTNQVVGKKMQAKQFALQLNEHTEISNDAQLVAFVRLPHELEIAGTYVYFVGP
jgi:hypothetical protein